MNIPTKEDFKRVINKAKMNAAINGEKHIHIQVKDIHIELGHYPGPNHRMKTCCDAMNTSNGDVVVSAPKSGKSHHKIQSIADKNGVTSL